MIDPSGEVVNVWMIMIDLLKEVINPSMPVSEMDPSGESVCWYRVDIYW